MTITDKIKQIIAKAQSTTSEAEADAFMAMAARLMEKHQIEAHQLGENDPMGFTRSDPRPKSGPSSYRPKVLAALARYYGCKPINVAVSGLGNNVKYSLELVGPESARVTTMLMMDFVWNQVVEQAAALSAEQGYDRGQMIRHVANALTIRLGKLTEEQKERHPEEAKTEAGKNALIAIGTSVEAYFKERWPKTNTGRSSRIKWSEAAGTAAGNISLARQTGGSTVGKIGK